MVNVLGLQDVVGVELEGGEKPFDLHYAHHFVCLFECKCNMRRAPDRLAKAVAPFGLSLASSELF